VLCDVAESSKVLPASNIKILVMEAVRSSETSVNFYRTAQRNIPEGSQRTSRGNLKYRQALRYSHGILLEFKW
jgi:hypothetical protein